MIPTYWCGDRSWVSATNEAGGGKWQRDMLEIHASCVASQRRVVGLRTQGQLQEKEEIRDWMGIWRKSILRLTSHRIPRSSIRHAYHRGSKSEKSVRRADGDVLTATRNPSPSQTGNFGLKGSHRKSIYMFAISFIRDESNTHRQILYVCPFVPTIWKPGTKAPPISTSLC